MLNRNSVRAALAAMAILFSAVFNGNVLGTTWVPGDVITYSQGSWSADPTAVSLLSSNYTTVYSSSLGVVEVGIPGSAGFSTLFSAPTAVFDYLPASSPARALNADLIDPTSTSSGAFGGNVLALTINIDFSDFGGMQGALGIPFGDLQLRTFYTRNSTSTA
jgi:hypothetical protein